MVGPPHKCIFIIKVGFVGISHIHKEKCIRYCYSCMHTVHNKVFKQFLHNDNSIMINEHLRPIN